MPRDDAIAQALWEKAAAQGNDNAKQNLSRQAINLGRRGPGPAAAPGVDPMLDPANPDSLMNQQQRAMQEQWERDRIQRQQDEERQRIERNQQMDRMNRCGSSLINC